MSRLVVASNRVAPPGPDDGAGGGLAVALRAALAARGGLWFGWSGRVAASPADEARVTRAGAVDHALLDLAAHERAEYYDGYANRALWPTMHLQLGLARYARADHAGYRRVNARFARALAPLLRADDLLWVNDYHLIPLARELRALGHRGRIGYFHHVPWPPAEVLAMLPGAGDLARAMGAHDAVGLQTEGDARNLAAALEEAGVAGEGRGGPRLLALPVGIDAGAFAVAAARAADLPEVAGAAARLAGTRVLIGADRLDVTKGLVERLEAYDRFLAANPDARGRVVHLQVTPRSRAGVPEVAALARRVDEAVGRLCGLHGTPGWAPVHVVARGLPRATLAGLLRLAPVGLVTPLRDGMNLVAKEYVAAQDPARPGALVLSRFAGAARQLEGALLVNPYDRFEVAEAIREALAMAPGERLARWEGMRAGLEATDLAWWVDAVLGAIAGEGAARAA